MSKTKVYLIIQAVLCVLLVVLLSVSAIGIYRDGMARRAENPRAPIYTRQIVAEKCAPVAPLAIISVVMLIAGLALGLRDEEADKPVKDSELVRDLTVKRVAHPSQAMKQARAAQKRLQAAGWVIFAVCMVPVAIYVANGEHFPGDLESMFYGLIRVLLPWTAAGIGALAVTSAMAEKHVLRETEAAKAQLAQERAEGVRTPVEAPAGGKSRRAVQAVVLVAAIVFIVLGVFNQSARDVLYKAITICTECVGLG